MEQLVEQLLRRGRELDRWLEIERSAPAEVRLVREDVDAARLADFDDSAAPVLAPGGDWREALNQTVWLRFRLTRPADWPVEDTALVAQRFGTHPLDPATVRIGRELQRMQGMLYLDGSAYHGLDQYHRLVYLPAGPNYHFAASVWTGLAEMDWQPNPTFHLARIDAGAAQLSYDLLILADALQSLPADDPARPQIERIAELALGCIDWGSIGSERFRRSLLGAHQRVNAALSELTTADYEPTLTAVGHAHIDCAWLWPISQTREKAGRTWTTALRLMERYPEYRFLASTPLQYEMVKQGFPETFAGIRDRIREGRWEAVGGMWVEADCNLPDGESLARQLLVGTRYFERELGVSPRVVWLPDSFGFTWALPTLMAAAGLPYFVTHKLSWSTTNRIPHDTFRWRGPDGSQVLAHFLCTPSLTPREHTTYNGHLLPGVARGAWRRFQDRQLQDELLVAFGWGDGGGGPTIDMLEAGRRLTSLPGFPRVEMGSAHAFFERLEQRLAAQPPAEVPVWDGELYLEYHRGTYTGQAQQKRRNALAQRLFHAAELYAATARALRGTEYPRAALDEGWKLILTNQFHDILPGSAISQVYREAELDFLRVTEIGSEIVESAIGSICDGLKLESEALVVFNPSPYPSGGYLEVPESAAVDVPLPSQPTTDGKVLVWCEGVPPNGYQAFLVGEQPMRGGDLRVSPHAIETPFWHLELNSSGRLSRLFDKTSEREVLPPNQPGNQLVVFEDRPINYDAWDIDAFYRAKRREVDQLESLEVRESGPERATLELRWRFGDRTRIVQRLCVYARSPRIDFLTEVDWQERQSLLKVAFPTLIRSRRATYEIQFGSIERPTHRNTSWDEAAFEVPAQRWADLSDASYGVALLADCKHGYSVQDSTLWLSLLKGAIDPDPEADRGQQTFTYSLLPHPAGLESVRRAAYDLSRPLLWRRAPAAHAGSLPLTFSAAHVDDPNLLVETVKWAEDEDALILRAYEAEGGANSAILHLGVTPDTVEEVDLLERNPRRVPLDDDGGVPLSLRAHEVKTLKVVAAAPERPSA
jgi:alpha-mannosidase